MRILNFPPLSDPRSANYWNLIFMFIFTFILIPLNLFDQSLISGAPKWIKPLKFSMSIGLYSVTFLWILQFMNLKDKWLTRISWTITITLLIEMIAIFGQVVRGEASHFNISSPLNGFIFSIMGTSIGIMWFAHLSVGIYIFRLKNINSYLRESLLWGICISAYGMIIGFFMTVPRPEQIELMQQGIMQVNGGHSFGAPDGGVGVLFLGWSTVAGDMRVPHFFGMHAIQFFSILSIFKLGLKPEASIEKINRTGLRFMAMAWFAISILMTIQALNGESIFRTSQNFLIGYIISGIIGIIGMVLNTQKFNFFLKSNNKTKAA